MQPYDGRVLHSISLQNACLLVLLVKVMDSYQAHVIQIEVLNELHRENPNHFRPGGILKDLSRHYDTTLPGDPGPRLVRI
jgi:hypothetical protein